MQKNTITPEILAGAVGLLRPFYPNLTAESLVQSIRTATAEARPVEETLLSKKVYAKRRGCSEMTIHRLMKAGKIPFIRVSKRLVKIPSSALNIDFTNEVGQ